MFYTLEKYEEAIADCERAITIDPNFTKVSLLLSSRKKTNYNTDYLARRLISDKDLPFTSK